MGGKKAKRAAMLDVTPPMSATQQRGGMRGGRSGFGSEGLVVVWWWPGGSREGREKVGAHYSANSSSLARECVFNSGI